MDIKSESLMTSLRSNFKDYWDEKIVERKGFALSSFVWAHNIVLYVLAYAYFLMFLIGFGYGLSHGDYTPSILAVVLIIVDAAGCASCFTASRFTTNTVKWELFSEQFVTILFRLMGVGLAWLVSRWLVSRSF